MNESCCSAYDYGPRRDRPFVALGRITGAADGAQVAEHVCTASGQGLDVVHGGGGITAYPTAVVPVRELVGQLLVREGCCAAGALSGAPQCSLLAPTQRHEVGVVGAVLPVPSAQALPVVVPESGLALTHSHAIGRLVGRHLGQSARAVSRVVRRLVGLAASPAPVRTAIGMLATAIEFADWLRMPALTARFHGSHVSRGGR